MCETNFSDLIDVNPSTNLPLSITGSDSVSFIPMGDVSESGQWINRQTRLLRQVRSGFTVFEEGDVLLAKITPCLENGKGVHALGLINAVGFGSTEFHVLRAKEGVDTHFIFHLSKWKKFRLAAERQMMGSAGQQRVPKSFFSEFRLPKLDAEEHSRIALILGTLDTAIHETEAIIEKLKAVKQGLLHDLLTRGIDANGELRPPQSEAPHLYKNSPLGWIPKEWEVAPLVTKVDFAVGQVDPKQAPYRDWVLIAPDHIEAGSGRLLLTSTAADQGAISGKYIFVEGDLLYSKIRPYLRKAILAETGGLCSADMYPLRPKDDINGRYLLAVILGNHFSQFAESVSMRSGFPKINRVEMAEYISGWPSYDEQCQIAKILAQFDSKQLLAEENLKKIQSENSGLMDDLLTGRVRVTPLLK